MENSKELQIKLIAGRIEDEYRKHSTLDWQQIAARKIHSQWFEYYTNQIEHLVMELQAAKEEIEGLKPKSFTAIRKAEPVPHNLQQITDVYGKWYNQASPSSLDYKILKTYDLSFRLNLVYKPKTILFWIKKFLNKNKDGK